MTEDRASVSVECIVHNTGAVSGDAVVMGFVTSSDTQFPRQRLFDFQRVRLAPDASVTVMLTASPDMLSVVDEQGRRWLREGRFEFRVGDVVRPAEGHVVELRGQPQLLEDFSGVFERPHVDEL